MSNQINQDETSGFEVESEDFPETELVPQEEAKEEQASSEVVESEGVSDSKKESTVKEEPAEDVKADDASAEVKEKPNGFQKRINKEVRKREDLKRENESQAKRIKELEGDTSDKQFKEPVEGDFDTYDKYLDALDKYDSTAETKEPAKDSEENKQKDTGGIL